MDEKGDEEFPRRGEIWLVETPDKPDDPHQPRPALLVSENVRNRLAHDAIVVPIFSRGRLGPTRVPIQAGEGGLRNDGIVFVEEITTLHHGFLVDGPIGPPVRPSLLERVVRAVRRAIGDVRPEPR